MYARVFMRAITFNVTDTFPLRQLALFYFVVVLMFVLEAPYVITFDRVAQSVSTKTP